MSLNETNLTEEQSAMLADMAAREYDLDVQKEAFAQRQRDAKDQLKEDLKALASASGIPAKTLKNVIALVKKSKKDEEAMFEAKDTVAMAQAVVDHSTGD